jgi:LAS superfamily LD-carboxypeptidase LdcB
MDGIGGIVIGNIFKINQDIIPKGYKGSSNREIAYIVAKLGHNISDNDWTTEINAYPIVLQKPLSTEVWKNWKNQQYPNSTIVLTNADGSPITQPPALDAYIPKNSNIPVIRYLAGKEYKNGQIPSDELRNLKIQDDPQSNNIHQLHPAAASQWEKLITAARSAGFSIKDTQISLIQGAAYRPISQQQEGPGRAPIGTSVHGWGAAVDIQSLIDYQRQFSSVPKGNPPAGAEAAAQTRTGNKFYQWLNTNAATYGWINPPKLKDGSGEDEAWHWEYWGPVSGGAIGQAEPQTISQPLITVETVVAALKDAANGNAFGFGTKEAALEDALSKIPDRDFFKQVNNKLNIENLLDSEIGTDNFDLLLLNRLKTKLSLIGVTLDYKIVKGILIDSIKTTIRF